MAGEAGELNRLRAGISFQREERISALPSAEAVLGLPLQIAEHELVCRIGGGSYGEVWLARSVLGTYRAVKIVPRRSFEQNESLDRELKGLQKFEPISRTHDGLVDILQVGQTEDNLYYIMELADSGDGGNRNAAGWTPSSYIPRTLRLDLTQRGWLPAGRVSQTAPGRA